MFTVTIKLDVPTQARFDRLMDYLEGVQQRQIDALTAKLKTMADGVEGAVAENQLSPK